MRRFVEIASDHATGGATCPCKWRTGKRSGPAASSGRAARTVGRRSSADAIARSVSVSDRGQVVHRAPSCLALAEVVSE